MRVRELHGHAVMLLAMAVAVTSACATQAGHEQRSSEPHEQRVVVDEPVTVEKPPVDDRTRSVSADEYKAALSGLRTAERRVAELEKTVKQMRSENDVLHQEIDQFKVQLAQTETARDQLQKKLDAILNPPEPTPESGNETQPPVDMYTVEPGDTFRRIASKTEVYGNEDRWQDLYEANRERIGLHKPEDLQTGMVLEIKRP